MYWGQQLNQCSADICYLSKMFGSDHVPIDISQNKKDNQKILLHKRSKVDEIKKLLTKRSLRKCDQNLNFHMNSPRVNKNNKSKQTESIIFKERSQINILKQTRNIKINYFSPINPPRQVLRRISVNKINDSTKNAYQQNIASVNLIKHIYESKTKYNLNEKEFTKLHLNKAKQQMKINASFFDKNKLLESEQTISILQIENHPSLKFQQIRQQASFQQDSMLNTKYRQSNVIYRHLYSSNIEKSIQVNQQQNLINRQNFSNDKFCQNHPQKIDLLSLSDIIQTNKKLSRLRMLQQIEYINISHDSQDKIQIFKQRNINLQQCIVGVEKVDDNNIKRKAFHQPSIAIKIIQNQFNGSQFGQSIQNQQISSNDSNMHSKRLQPLTMQINMSSKENIYIQKNKRQIMY